MARPQRCRRVCKEPAYDSFAPRGICGEERVVLFVPELEVIRLIDMEGKTHVECALQMDISRSTAQEIYESARKKLALCLVEGRELVIEGGNYRICNGESEFCSCKAATRKKKNEKILLKKGSNIMRIAVTHENGNIFPHFGHTAEFKIYETENNEILSSVVVSTMGSGHGALASFLKNSQVDTLICGGIGGGAQTALANVGISVYGGVSGSADKAVKALLEGTLNYNPDVKCSHHDHEHGHGEHTCSDHGCGSGNCHH